MVFSNVCRTCLGTDSLNPIFKVAFHHKRYSTAVYLSTGIKVEMNDGLPQNMCTSCITQVNNSVVFRQLCKDTETQMLEIKGKLDTEASHLLSQTCQKNIAKRMKSQETISSLSDSSVIKTEYRNIDEPEVKVEHTDRDALEINSVYMDIDAQGSDDDDKPLTELVKLKSDNTDAENICNKNLEAPFKLYIPSSTPNRVTCQLCQKELSIRSISAHVSRCHPSAPGGGGQARRRRRLDHRGFQHSEEATECECCKLKFDSKETLVEHMKTCTAKKKKRKPSESTKELRECTVCHKVMQKGSLRLHTAVAHAGLRPVCEHCGKRFGNKFRLHEHYRAKHGYEKFKCSRCDFQSASNTAMRNHERRHRGEKPFVCEACGARFHAAYLLAQHRHSHRTDKLFKCPQCPATFKANNSLHMHRLTCHSAARYQCTMCARAYSCRHYAVKHIRFVHHYRGPVPKLQRLPAPQPDADNEAT